MKSFLLLISFLFLFASCLGNDIYFQGLAEEETVSVLPSVVEEKKPEPKPKPKPKPVLYQGQKEEFVLKKSHPKVDILILVDSSQSMYHHLNKLGKSLSHLLSVISNYDWQIAFTSVDHGDHNLFKRRDQQKWQDNVNNSDFKFGRLMKLDSEEGVLDQRVLNKNMADYEDIFYQTLSHNSYGKCRRPPYCSGSLEQALRSLKSALERQKLDNADFFRPKADLVTLIITNEGERDGDKKRATQAIDVLQTFEQVFSNSNKQFINFNILVKDFVCRRQEAKKGNIATIGASAMELATLTGGENIDICSEDYGTQLEKISKHIKHDLENSLVLKEVPIPGSVRIDFGQFEEIPWSLQGKKIVFTGEIEINRTVSVYYKVNK